MGNETLNNAFCGSVVIGRSPYKIIFHRLLDGKESEVFLQQVKVEASSHDSFFWEMDFEWSEAGSMAVEDCNKQYFFNILRIH